jgi:hypothetical protein
MGSEAFQTEDTEDTEDTEKREIETHFLSGSLASWYAL